MTFLHRVSVESANGRYLYHAQAEEAERLIESGRAVIYALRGVKVSILRMSEHQAASDILTMGLRPGSFGIQRETFSGHVVFSHKPHYGELLGA
jgi:hypothetical protein